MSQENISGKKINLVSSDDLLGKDVIDKVGAIIGTSEKVLIDKDKLKFDSIEVSKGIISKNLVIGKDYIEKITDHAIFLNIRLAHEIKGMDVYDKNGSKIGDVVDLTMEDESNKINTILVKSKIMKKKEIPIKYVEKIGYNVILNISKEEFNKLG